MVVGATHRDVEDETAEDLCIGDAAVAGGVGVCVCPSAAGSGTTTGD